MKNTETDNMKTYQYGTDAGTGKIKAVSPEDALAKLGLTESAIEDGAWGWVKEEGTQDRVNVGRKYTR